MMTSNADDDRRFRMLKIRERAKEDGDRGDKVEVDCLLHNR